eukprot:293840-Rhodomonas_salina.2
MPDVARVVLPAVRRGGSSSTGSLTCLRKSSGQFSRSPPPQTMPSADVAVPTVPTLSASSSTSSPCRRCPCPRPDVRLRSRLQACTRECNARQHAVIQ